MDRRSDLVRDSELDTQCNPEYTVHTYREVSTSSEPRVVQRHEYWRRESQIGQGGYGHVWLEKCVQGHQDVELRAVKQVSTKPFGKGRPIEYSRELEAIAKFSHRKYAYRFVKSFGWYENGENLFITMEYLPHSDLGQHMSTASPLSEDAAGNITYQILEGLSYMHDNGFAHRDLKPQNILIKSCPPQEWWIKIGDFGISKRLEVDAAISTILKGTPGFIAPELYNITPMGTPFAADMWSLGEISFQLMTKQPVFQNLLLLVGYTTQNQDFPLTHLRAHNVSNPCQNFISSLMVPTPEKRLTAEAAQKHQWMTQYLPSVVQPFPLPQSTSLPSDSDSISEVLGSWNSVSNSSPSPNSIKTLRPKWGGGHQLPREKESSQPTLKDFQGQAKATRRMPYQFGKFEGHENQVWSVAFSPDGTAIASGSGDRTVRIWDAVTRAELARLEGHTQEISMVKFSPDGTTIASGSYDGSVKIWDAIKREELLKLEGHTDAVRSVAFSPDGSTIASGSYDTSVRIWDAASGRHLLELNGHTATVRCIAFLSNGETLASSSAKELIRIWNVSTRSCIRQLSVNGSNPMMGSVAYSPNGSLILYPSRDIAIMWNATSGNRIREFKGFEERFLALAFSPDSTIVVAASSDRSVRTWDVNTGRQLQRFTGHERAVESVAFSPDGTTIVCGSADGSLRTWKVIK